MSETNTTPSPGRDASLDEDLIICVDCGEIFDDNNQRERDHHAQPNHLPLLPPRYPRN